jgi:hypothetical protein
MTREPLQVLVIAHPGSALSATLARQIYGWLTRDPERPTARGLGIPVRLVRTSPVGQPEPIDLGLTDRTVVVGLVSDEMLLDDAWSQVVADVAGATAAPSGPHRLLPVALSRNATKLAGVTHEQFVRLEGADPATMADALRVAVLQALCRHLLDRRPAGADAGVAKAPVRVFVSHAKRDGVSVAQTLVAELDAMGLNRFFDARDIAPGHCFDAEIEGHIEDSAVVAVATDAFGGRHWCQREVLAAKRRGRPLVVVDAMRHGEARRFPYVGNSPVLRWDPDRADDRVVARRVIASLLDETLRAHVAKLSLDRLAELGIVHSAALRIPRPPELLTLPHVVSGDPTVLVHPDPPLGEHEVRVLVSREPGLVVTTPTTLASGAGVLPELTGKTVGISISKPPDEHLAARGLADVHVDDLWVELGRWLLACGATLAYGGDLRTGGFTEVLFDLFRSRCDEGASSAPLQSWLAWPIHLDLTMSKETDWLGLVKFHRVPQAVNTGLPADVAVSPDESLAARFAWARSLTRMRRQMTGVTHARIIVGGQLTALGPYPGVAEEARLAIEAEQPTYILGGLGGCAAEIASLLGGGDAPTLTREFQSRGADRERFIPYYDARVPADETADFDRLRRVFAEAGWSGLRNGLSADENTRLASTADVPDMISLLLKGLRATL